MSAPNPTHIDVLVEHRWDKSQGRCACQWSPDYRNTHRSGLHMHAAHVVSKLTDAGYSITPTPPLTAEQRDPDGNHIFDQGCDLAVCIECGVTRSEHQRARAAAAERDTNG